jgi:integrase
VHDLRHTYGSLLAAHGRPAIEIQACMGHQDPKTAQRYLHAREASEMVSDQAGAFD